MADSLFVFLFFLRGSAESHHLGHGDGEHMRFPKQVEALSGHKVVDIAVGSQHCLVLTSQGDVLGWGKNSNGEVDSSAEAIPVPTVISGASRQGVVSISCGAHEVTQKPLTFVIVWLIG